MTPVDIDKLIIKIEEDNFFSNEEVELIIDALILYKEINT